MTALLLSYNTLVLVPIARSSMFGTFPRSSRLGWLGERHQIAQDCRSPAQALLGFFPIVEEHDLHVGPHPRGATLIVDEGNQAVWIGESIIAERNHRAFGTGFDLLHIRLPAEHLAADDLEQVLDFQREW